MAGKGQAAYAPSMADVAVKAKTGKDWKGWFAVLDKAGAAKLAHKNIAALLYDKHKVPGWWCQMVAVEYERARGLRARNEQTGGYSVSVSKTVAADLSTLYAAVADAKTRAKWFPKGKFTPSSQTKSKYFRGAWEKGRLEVGFIAKGDGKAQIAVQVNKLAKQSDVETTRVAWKAALDKLAKMLSG